MPFTLPPITDPLQAARLTNDLKRMRDALVEFSKLGPAPRERPEFHSARMAALKDDADALAQALDAYAAKSKPKVEPEVRRARAKPLGKRRAKR